jgi:hypothetical protein
LRSLMQGELIIRSLYYGYSLLTNVSMLPGVMGIVS